MLSGLTEKTLLPFQGAINVTTVPGALPRAMRSLGFQPADSNGGESLLISDEPKRGGGCLLRVTICACLLSF